MGRVFANGPGDRGSTPGQVIPKTLKMVLDTSLLKTQQHKVHIKGKVEPSRERSSDLPLHTGVVAIEREPSGRLQLKGDNFTTLHFYQDGFDIKYSVKVMMPLNKETKPFIFTKYRAPFLYPYRWIGKPKKF